VAQPIARLGKWYGTGTDLAAKRRDDVSPTRKRRVEWKISRSRRAATPVVTQSL
jgi:hypothetical protein